ncbi:MAG: hypothetical protein CMN55_03560 [Sneathiella sp.]|jgi:hypothetical protein|uniref:hypothetical protein n=1 Tax=Sneathiella sp. TaxID=1964365 RepID=UPI000C42D139|nr:hypothetical protein [Sneathiella sp.]MAL78180.1 hypothetical protein [Sneathiella sp.]
MKNFSTDAAGFAALTLSELILQQCLLGGLIAPEEARRLLGIAVHRHEEAANGSEEKIALNMEAAHILRLLSHGLEPLLADKAANDDNTAAPAASEPLRWPGRTGETPQREPPSRRANWVRFPD